MDAEEVYTITKTFKKSVKNTNTNTNTKIETCYKNNSICQET